MVLNPALVAQLATLSLSPRLALALFAACRGLSKQAVKAVAQTLLDYTPEDPSVDQEALTLGLNLAGIVHACNATAAAMLRGFCVLLAKQCAALFVGGAVNGEGAEGFVADASLEVARLLYTAFEDCNEVVCDAAVALATGEAEALVHAEAKESEELYEYIEKSMSTRVKVVPAEIRATMADVMSCVLACFAKNVGEEIRANVMYDYQYRSVEVNLAFLLTMAKGVLKDTSAVKERFVDTLNSAFERCYEPGDMEEEVQKKEILAAMEHFTELVMEKWRVCYNHVRSKSVCAATGKTPSPHPVSPVQGVRFGVRAISAPISSRNDISVRKRMTIGLTGFACVCGCAIYGGRKWYQRRHCTVKVEEATAFVPPAVDTTPTDTTQEKEDDSAFLPWWTGVSEISLYVNEQETENINNRFQAKYAYV